jgi:NTE family protein
MGPGSNAKTQLGPEIHKSALNSFSEQEQCELINWGYALCDAAMRSFVLPGYSGPNPAWPYKNFALG